MGYFVAEHWRTFVGISNELVFEGNKPKIDRIDTERNDGTAIVYFPIKGEKFFLAVYLDTIPNLEVRAVSTEPYNSVRFVASSENLNLKELSELTTLKYSAGKNQGEKRSSEFILKNYSARKIIYIDSVSGIQNAESLFLFLNGINYVVTYSQVDTFIEKNKDNFMRSLVISNSDTLSQIQPPIKSSSYVQFVLYAILTIGFILFFRRKTKDKSPIGINLNAVYCPKCQTKQPFIRIPKNSDQFLFGGTNCPKCHTKLDKYGRII